MISSRLPFFVSRAAPFVPYAMLLTSSGSYTVPTGATTIRVWVVGAGSGGAYNDVSGNSAGATVYKELLVAGGQSWSISIAAADSSSDTTFTLGANTLRAKSGRGAPYWNPPVTDAIAKYDTRTWLQISGGTVLVWGGRGGYGGGCGSDFSVRGGAVGGNALSPVQCPPGICSGGRRYVMTDVSGLKNALTLAAAKTTDTCSGPQAFGSGAINSKFYGTVASGLGGGGANGVAAGGGAVVIQYT